MLLLVGWVIWNNKPLNWGRNHRGIIRTSAERWWSTSRTYFPSNVLLGRCWRHLRQQYFQRPHSFSSGRCCSSVAEIFLQVFSAWVQWSRQASVKRLWELVISACAIFFNKKSQSRFWSMDTYKHLEHVAHTSSRNKKKKNFCCVECSARELFVSDKQLNMLRSVVSANYRAQGFFKLASIPAESVEIRCWGYTSVWKKSPNPNSSPHSKNLMWCSFAFTFFFTTPVNISLPIQLCW